MLLTFPHLCYESLDHPVADASLSGHSVIEEETLAVEQIIESLIP